MRNPLPANVYYFLKRLATQTPSIPVRRRHRFGTKLSVSLQTQTGYAIKGVSKADTGPMEALERLLAPGDVFYDVGANIGLYSVAAGALVRASGRVVALEPDPANCALLLKNLHLNSISGTVVQVAVGDRADVAEFVVDRMTSATGHLKSPGYSEPIVSEWSRVVPRSTRISVSTVRLDDLVFGAQFPAPTVIKIDVERHELHVLRGMPKIMKEARPHILIEVDSQNQQALLALLTETRYEISESFSEGNLLLRPLGR